MNAGVTFERVYRALKEQLGSGRFTAGQHLEPVALSHDLNVSITPVRDALHRLAGEGLVETPGREGFRTPWVTEIGLRHLYRWNGVLLGWGAQGRDGGHDGFRDSEIQDAGGPIEAAERLFLTISARSGNPEHRAAITRLNDRLRPARQAELIVLADCEEEVAALSAALAADESRRLKRSLAAFHRRRERQVDEIVAALVARR